MGDDQGKQQRHSGEFAGHSHGRAGSGQDRTAHATTHDDPHIEVDGGHDEGDHDDVEGIEVGKLDVKHSEGRQGRRQQADALVVQPPAQEEDEKDSNGVGDP